MSKKKKEFVSNVTGEEWYKHNSDISTKDINEADVIWLMAGWVWSQIPLNVLKSTKVVVTQHHVDPVKFSENDFRQRDIITDCYHVPNKFTKDFIKDYTDKIYEFFIKKILALNSRVIFIKNM